MTEDDETTGGWLNWHRRLTVRLVALLTLALLPLGLLAFLQTGSLTDEVERRTELSLVAKSQASASGELALLQRAIGAAEALSVAIRDLRDDPEACSQFLRDYLEQTERYSFVGWLAPTGELACSSVEPEVVQAANADFSQDLVFPRLSVRIVPDPAFSTVPVVVLTVPIVRDGQADGVIYLSVPRDRFSAAFDRTDPATTQPLSVVAFNNAGEVLSGEMVAQTDRVSLPSSFALDELTSEAPAVLVDTDQSGEQRLFVHGPLLGDAVYFLTAWADDAGVNDGTAPASVIPALMWLASILVAAYAVHRLVVRHVMDLTRRMSDFARDRTLKPVDPGRAGSVEVARLEASFEAMALGLLSDEAVLESEVRERNVLLKEVHHRVKNNLQMISSIMSMNMRRSKSDETRKVLSRLQERVQGMSAIHRNLYKMDDLSRANAGSLLREVVAQIVTVNSRPETGMNIQTEFGEVPLFPDQALPLSLLTSELVTNAMKFADAEAPNLPAVEVDFGVTSAGYANLRVTNTTAGPMEGTENGIGLGAQLIKAFSSQLGTTPEIVNESGRYSVSVEFEIESFREEALDY